MNHWIHGSGDFRNRPPLVTHCLVVDTGAGLLLVDTGFGRRDYTHPAFAVRAFNWASNFHYDQKETAFAQIQALGYRSEDVRHIAITHMHLDHVGGLADFPAAKVHIYAEEYQGITHPRTLEEKYVCRREHWAHSPNWVIHQLDRDRWYGFECTPQIHLGDISITFVPLIGHTRGHSAVAVKSPTGWLLNCGDAYVYHGDVDQGGPYYPPKHQLTLKIMGLFAHAFRVLGSHSHRLRKLRQDHDDEVKIFCTHDPYEFSTFTEHG